MVALTEEERLAAEIAGRIVAVYVRETVRALAGPAVASMRQVEEVFRRLDQALQGQATTPPGTGELPLLHESLRRAQELAAPAHPEKRLPDVLKATVPSLFGALYRGLLESLASPRNEAPPS